VTGPRTEPTSGRNAAASTEPRPWTPPQPTGADLVRQVRDVVADLPRFLSAPLLRPWHRTWGASHAEVAGAMPGDDLLPTAQYRCTRAITIAASPEEVWPWLVQVGCLRAGWYADDLLDNLAHPSARSIAPQLQDLDVGRWLPMSPTPRTATAFTVDSFERPHWMLWRTPTSTWSWRLIPLRHERTRLLTRLHTRYDWRHPATAALAVLLMEVGDWPMMRRMLLGIRARAEAEHHPDPPPPGDRRPLLGLRRRPGRLALMMFRLPLQAYRHNAGPAVGRTFLAFTHVGRRTGRPHEAVAMVLRYDAAIREAVICAAWGPQTDWYRNLGASPALKVQLGSASFAPQQRFLGEQEAFDVLVGFRRAHPHRLRLLSAVLGWGDLREDAALRSLVADHPMVAFRPVAPDEPDGGAGQNRTSESAGRPTVTGAHR